MFKWPGTPSPSADAHELADFAELSAWQKGRFSRTELSRILGRLGENDHSGGVRIDDAVADSVEAAYNEIEQRAEVCGSGYPFALIRRAQTLRFVGRTESVKHIIYQYLLLATRLIMSSNRIHGNIDGTLVFEELAAEVARNYLGDRARSFVFGTANQQPGFLGKVNDLCGQLGEGGGFVNRNATMTTAQDGKLDVVAWKPFTDGRSSKLILFGQCKTGTSYEDTLTQLQPDGFCRKWLQDPLLLTPVRVFFITEALRWHNWHNTAVDAGLLFDRCRIVDFCDGIDAAVITQVVEWTAAAAQATGLPN